MGGRWELLVSPDMRINLSTASCCSTVAPRTLRSGNSNAASAAQLPRVGHAAPAQRPRRTAGVPAVAASCMRNRGRRRRAVDAVAPTQPQPWPGLRSLAVCGLALAPVKEWGRRPSWEGAASGGGLRRGQRRGVGGGNCGLGRGLGVWDRRSGSAAASRPGCRRCRGGRQPRAVRRRRRARSRRGPAAAGSAAGGPRADAGAQALLTPPASLLREPVGPGRR